MLVPAIVNGGSLLIGPATPGTAGQLLRSTGDGAMDWADPGPATAGGNIDGGNASSVYGGTTHMDGGDA